MLKNKAEYSKIPIYLITAVITPDEKEQLMKVTGADGIIFKPIKSLASLDILLPSVTQ